MARTVAGTRTAAITLGISSTTNFIPNPSFEYDAVNTVTPTGWTVNTPSNLVQKITDEQSLFGSKSFKAYPNSGTENYIYVDVPYGLNQTWILSLYYKCASYTSGNLAVQIKSTDFISTYSSVNLSTTVGDWERYSVSIKQTSIATAKLRIIFDYTVGTADFIYYIDGVQWEKASAARSYCDGSLGAGYSWNGTAHNSISNRTNRNVSSARTSI